MAVPKRFPDPFVQTEVPPETKVVVKVRIRPVLLVEIPNVPPLIELANPPVPFVAPVLIVKLLLEKPMIPAGDTEAIVQLVLLFTLNPDRDPMLQRFTLKRLLEVREERSILPLTASKSAPASETFQL